MLYVIAKYKEDVSWCNKLQNKIVYDKSDGSMPNVGREASTYLRYIIDHYDNLPSHVVFLQGNPFDHVSIPIDFTATPQVDYCKPFFKDLNTEPVDYYQGLHIREYFMQIFGKPPPNILDVSYGAQYIVPKMCILQHPIEFYKKLLSMLKNDSYEHAHYYNTYDPESLNAWTMERLWYYIFT